MLTNGFVTILRDIKGSALEGDAKAMGVLLDLILSVNFKDTKTRGIELKAGQCIIGVEEYGKKFKMPKSTMKGVLARIVKAGFADLTPTSKYTIVTLKNCIQKSDHRPLTDLSPTSHRPLADPLEIKEIKEINVNNGKKEKGAPAPELSPSPEITVEMIVSEFGQKNFERYAAKVRNWMKRKRMKGEPSLEMIYKWLDEDRASLKLPDKAKNDMAVSFDVDELEKNSYARYQKKSSINIELVKEKAYAKYRKE